MLLENVILNKNRIKKKHGLLVAGGEILLFLELLRPIYGQFQYLSKLHRMDWVG